MAAEPQAQTAAARARALLAALDGPPRAEALAWLRRGLPEPGAPFARGPFFGFYAGAGRRLREPPLALDAAALAPLVEAGVVRPEVWSAPDLARGALLLAACAALPADQHVALLTEAFRKGDNGERVALLRALPLLPDPARFTALAIEACRTHVLEVFAAIACDNPFASGQFPEPNFNQLVMKSLFVELPLERVIGWRDRLGDELVRMARDYRAERTAAGRPVPADVALIEAARAAATAASTAKEAP
jgi:hypothetical protein